MLPSNKNSVTQAITRVRIWYGVLLVAVGIFGLRLFYIQVIHYNYYKAAALSDQLKQYEIPATRGIIEAHDGNAVLPIVLNEQLYTLYADPTLVKHPDQAGNKIAAAIGGNPQDYTNAMQTKKTRYVVLSKK